MSGQPKICPKCGAVLCLMAPENEILRCAFCELARVAAPEIQRYTLQNEVEIKQEEDIRYVFLIDRSGSMGRTTLPGLNDKSPLEILVAYVKNKLNELVASNPKSKVGLIFFNDTLRIIGDGNIPPVVLNDESCLKDQEKLRDAVKTHCKNSLTQPIEKSVSRLIETIKDDDATNQTALGPAIIAGLELLKGGNSGSKLLIFTDGVANIGVGNLDLDCGPIDEKFYENVMVEARNDAVEISLYKISLQDCMLKVFQPLTSETYGSLMEVNPALIATAIEIQDKQEDLARMAEISIRIPEIFKYTLVMEPLLLKGPNIFTKKHGRIVEATSELLQFVLNPKACAGKEVEKLERVPFQLTIMYIGPDRKRYLIVLTKMFNVKHDKKEKTFDPEIMHAYVNKIVQDGARADKLADVEPSIADLLESYISASSNPHAEGLIEHAKNLHEGIKPKVVVEVKEEEKKKGEEKKIDKEEQKFAPGLEQMFRTSPLKPKIPMGVDGLIMATTVKYSQLKGKKK